MHENYENREKNNGANRPIEQDFPAKFIERARED